MGYGLYLNISNASNAVVSATLTFNGMTAAGHASPPPQTLTLGPYERMTQLYCESQDASPNSNIVIAMTCRGETAASTVYESLGSYFIQGNSNAEVMSVELVNAVNGLSQAWLGVMMLPAPGLGYAGWMSDWADLCALALNQICLPGSHDAGTYTVQTSPYEIEDAIIMTQSQNITGQLMSGARFFDIRPGTSDFDAANPLSTTLYHMHCPSSSMLICCAPFTDMLNQFAAFAKAYPKEPIIIQLSHFQANVTGTTAQTMLKTAACQQLYNILGQYMVPNDFDITQSLATLQGSGHNIFVLVDTTDGIPFGQNPNQVNVSGTSNGNVVTVNSWFWPMPTFNAPSPPMNNWNNYANSSVLSFLLNWLIENTPTSASASYAPSLEASFDLLQCQLSPQGWDIAGYSNILQAAQSNPMVQQLCGMHMNPNSALAQAFATYVNCFLMDGIGSPGSTTIAADLAIASNAAKIALTKGITL